MQKVANRGRQIADCALWRLQSSPLIPGRDVVPPHQLAETAETEIVGEQRVALYPWYNEGMT